MASICGTARRTNTGSFDCDEARKFPSKLSIGGKVFSAAETADEDTFKAAILAATKLPTGNGNKLFFINALRDPADNTEANKEGAVGEGVPQVLVEGKPKFTYRVEIGQDLYKRLRKFNKRKVPIATYDDAGNYWGAGDSDGNLSGCSAYFFITGNTQQTASAPVSALITISYLSAAQYHDEAFYAPVELGEFEPKGLLDVYLTKISNSTNVYKIDAKAPTGIVNRFINYSTEYSTLWSAALFIAKTGATFATTLAITTVAYDSALLCLTVTFDSTAYTALASGAKIQLSLVDPATLDAADVTDIEGVSVILVK